MTDTPPVEPPLPVPPEPIPPKVVEADARNRALRTAVQVVAIEALVVVLPLALDVLDGRLDSRELLRSAVRALLGALLAYVMRKRAAPPVQIVASSVAVAPPVAAGDPEAVRPFLPEDPRRRR